MKICSRCKEEKQLDQFHKRSRSKDGLQSQCKKCNTEQRSIHYRSARGQEIAEIARFNHRNSNRQYLLEYLLEHPCVDCGESDPVVLEFDHRVPSEKYMNISKMIPGHSWENILKEIEKCDVVCANDHKRRTAKQFNWFKASVN